MAIHPGPFVLPPRNGLSLCAGGGGFDMGIMLAEPGFHSRCYVEWEEYPRQAIIAGQRAGYLAPAPIWDNVKTFDATRLRGCIDTLLAGYPCQPFSNAGERKGEDDERHLWPDIERIIGELGPALRWVILENVDGHFSLGLTTVLRSLRRLGFRTAVGSFSAAEVGATHPRKRVYIVAYRQSSDGRGELETKGTGCRRSRPAGSSGNPMANASVSGTRDQPGTPDQCGRDALGTGTTGIRCTDGAVRADQPDAASGGLADTNGQDRGADGRQPKPGADRGDVTAGDGRGDVENTGRSERGPINAQGGDTNRDDARRIKTSGRVGKSGENLEHAKGVRRGQGRAEPIIRGRGWPTAAVSGGAVADSLSPGLERHPGDEHDGDQPGWVNAQQERSATPCRPYLFPPGPDDAAEWASVLGSAHDDLAPAMGFNDILARAIRRAALIQTQGRKAIEPVVRRMVDGLAARTRALRLLGNGVVPLQAGYAFRTLSIAHGLRPVDLERTETET